MHIYGPWERRGRVFVAKTRLRTAETLLSQRPSVAVACSVAVVVTAPPRRGGVAADRARDVTGRLRSQGLLARALGGVVYLLASPMTDPVACAPLQAKLDAAVRAACAGGK
mgnify:CR=1 FL=1